MKIRNFAIGTDIEDISRFITFRLDKDYHLLNKLFTKKELDYCYSKKVAAPHLAVRFAAKEAIFKALCSVVKMKNICHKKIEISNKNGVPMSKINDKILNKFQIKLSLSHCKDKALATAIVIELD